MKALHEFINNNKKYIQYFSSNITEKKECDKIITEFKKIVYNRTIAIWGAGCVGRDLVRLFKEINIPVRLVVDKNADIIQECMGEIVYSIEKMKELPSDAIVIGACNRNILEDLVHDLCDLDANVKDMICGHDLHTLLQSAWCMIKAYDKNQVIDLKHCYECTVLDNTCNSLCQYLKRINGYKQQESYRTNSIKMIGYLLSNICTLRCKNCCEKVPYMPHDIRHFVTAETVVKDINKMAEACDFLTLLEFIGGEPFLHPKLPEILDAVKKITNIGMIHIFTNGTVIPSDDLCKSLQNERITVYLSNYQVSYPENMKKNVGMTVQKLTEYQVQFFFGKKTTKWFAHIAESAGVDKILFPSRDGYLIQKVYNCLMGEKAVPSVYFRTSRRAVTVAAIKNMDDIRSIAKRTYQGTCSDFLRARFGIEMNAGDVRVDRNVQKLDREELENLLKDYENRILSNASEEREHYLAYLNEMGIHSQDKMLIFDFVAGGTVQHAMERLLGTKLQGVYFATMNLPNSMYEIDTDEIQAAYGNIESYKTDTNLGRHYLLMETVLVDGKDTLAYIDENLNAVYEHSVERTNVQDIMNLQQGVLRYVKDYLTYFDDLDPDLSFADEIYGLLFSEGCIVPNSVKKIFENDDYYDGQEMCGVFCT